MLRSQLQTFVWFGALGLVFSSSVISGDNLRVEIEVRDEDDSVVDRHLVLFDGEMVYDFGLTEPHDVTVIDPAAERVTLLSLKDQVRTSVSTKTLISTTARARADAKTRGLEAALGIAAETQRSGTKYTLSFENKAGNYRYVANAGKPTATGDASKFAAFTDWACRINLIRRLGPTPPFGRMNLTKTIAGDGLVPELVELNCSSQRLKKTFVSRYSYSGEFADADARRIADVAGWIGLYKVVPFESFPR